MPSAEGIQDIKEVIKEDIASYLGREGVQETARGQLLRSLVESYERDIYLDEVRLESALQELGADMMDVYKVCLMTRVTGFEALLEADERTTQHDIHVYVKNAVVETGFNQLEVLGLVSDIVLSLGIGVMEARKGFLHEMEAALDQNDGEDVPYVVPVNLYRNDLNNARGDYDKYVAGEVGDTTRIAALAQAGVPKAKYYLGDLMLHHHANGGDPKRAVALLKEAAAAGDVDAAATLGDYYYDRGVGAWGKAYDYYTGYGSLGLDYKRGSHLKDILNHKMFNGKLLCMTAILLAVMLVLLVMAPGSVGYEAHRVIGTIAFVLDAAMFAVACVHYRTQPYDSLYMYPVGMFLVWCVYMLLRVVI